MIAKGERPTQVARTLGIDVKTLRSWRKDAAEGRTPGQRAVVPLPMDAAPGALSIVKEEGETIAEMMARLIPVNTPEGVYKNMMLQKIMTALEGSPVPVPTKISEFRQLAQIAGQLLGVAATPGRPTKGAGFAPGVTNLTVKIENLSKGPRMLEAVIVEPDEPIDLGEEG